jgi:hypothetical protein
MTSSPALEQVVAADSPLAAANSSPRMSAVEWGYLAAFLLVNLVVRFAVLGINQAEYTDGILQLTVFEKAAGLYPPLYGALAWLVEAAAGSRETAGRVVSAAAGSLALIPVYLLTLMLARPWAARFAALFYTFCPLVLRWSIRVMADSLFLCLSSFAILCMLRAFDQKSSRAKADAWLGLASVLAAASALTRYQGAFLLILLAIEIGVFAWRWRALPWRTLLASCLWAALPLWIYVNGFVHQTQFTHRTTGQWVSTLLAWLNLAESFVLIFPYYVGWPIFLFALVGLMRVDWHQPLRRHFLLLWVVWGAMLLVLQSVFGSFQYRYLMPVFPAVIALAGAGATYLEWKWRARTRAWIFSALLTVALAYLMLFSAAVLIFQRQAFGDQRAAAQFIRNRVPRSATVISNERYGNFLSLGCVKLTYWSGRPVEPLFEYLPARPEDPLPKVIPAGSYVVLGNAYGGDDFCDYLAAILTYYYHMRYTASFDTTVYPLMDDIMVNPMFNQNPLGWVLRYTPQLFSTHVYVVDGVRTLDELEELRRRQMPVPAAPAPGQRYRSARPADTRPTTSTAEVP